MTLSFKNMEATEVLKVLSEQGNLDMVLHSDVRGQLTIYLTDVTVAEALDAVCDIGDLAYEVKGGIYHVMSAARYLDMHGMPFAQRMETKTFSISSVDPTTLLQSVQQLRSKDGKAFADRGSYSLVVIDRPDAVSQIEKLVETLDRAPEMRSFTLQHVDVNSVLPKIQSFLSPGAKLQVDVEGNRVLVQDAAAIIIQVAQVIAEFDKPREITMKAFELAHAQPAVIVQAVTPELTPGVGRIYPDEKTNKVLVTDFPAKLTRIADLIQSLDVMTPQVLIEAKIVQVTLNDQYQMGVNWEVVSNKLNEAHATAVFNALAAGDPGVRVSSGDLSRDDYTAMVEALATIGKTNLVSSPRILALNNEEASILVGSTIPYKTIDTREENGSIRTFEKVTTVDVGVKLRVTPRIHEDNLISMSVRPEVSSVTGFSDNIPIVQTSETTTSVMVPDGATVVIAGLIEEKEVLNRKGVPILAKIPLLGMPFRSTDKGTEKRELVIFLTPHIVTGRGTED